MTSQNVRYQFSNHLGSASLELDETGALITYEEYYPYGSTSFQMGPDADTVSRKRYRYTGKERDEGTGFYYIGARYYIPWLARWAAVDPLEAKYAPESTYCYCLNNPIGHTDQNGKEVTTEIKDNKISFNATVFVFGENGKQLAADAQKAFDDLSKTSLQNRTYGETDASGNLVKEWNVDIHIKFLEGTQADYDRISNDKNENSGENLIVINNSEGRAMEGARHGTNYKPSTSKVVPNQDYPDKPFKLATGRSSGNMADVFRGNTGQVVVHESLHMLGLGDRYSDVSYQSEYNGKITYTDGMSVGHLGFENDVMNDHRSTGFAQVHVDDLAKAALATFAEKGTNTFFMGRTVDKSTNTDASAVPQRKPIKDITDNNKPIGWLTNPIYVRTGWKDPRSK